MSSIAPRHPESIRANVSPRAYRADDALVVSGAVPSLRPTTHAIESVGLQLWLTVWEASGAPGRS